MRPTFVQPTTLIAIVAASLPGFLQGLLGLAEVERQAALCVFGGASLLTSTAGMWWAERRPGNRALGWVLSAYFVSTLFALWVSDGQAFLMAMPLVSLLVVFLPLWASIGASATLLVLLAAMLAVDPTRVLFSFGSAFVFVIVFTLIAKKERYARAEVQRLSAELELLAATRERNRIAREIHDSVGHYLTVANVQLEAARATEAGRDERLARVQELLREGLGQLRESVSMLREAIPTQQPFANALEELVNASRQNGLEVALHVRGAPRPLAGAVGFTLFRATQEALTNAQRHAAARKIDVALEYAPESVRLEVKDDGRGPPASGVEPGNGLKGMRERVGLIGGAIDLGGAPGVGFAVTIEVPA